MSVSFVSSNRCSVDTRNCFRTGLFGVKGQTFFRDLLELEESLRNSIDNASDSQSAIVDERIAKRQDHAEQDGNRSKNDVQNDVTLVDRARDSINSMATSTCKIHSNIQLERKVNAPCLRDAVAERSIGPRKMLTTDQQNQVSKSTQTEYVYVIRAVRSCPVRRRRLPLHLQLHRLVSGRDAVCSKTAYASLNLSTYIFRKASDNLIYEKGKASRSPSYIPSPERHRWKYVTPSKVK
ncbi:uncharacterized protein LOC126915963 [Bombus affinis]|uniref:uncharacterized protein LOC126915963 n=1 Tax=Bombus affinis TaxID=309941 RepID=UPI0021B838B6|nr:uncharacterized protein LOC126915963 [Bombus affinis]XP_050577215.1 uncharacterized protein LOC126915963 [Bombus affinis]